MPVLRKRGLLGENKTINGLYIHSSPPRVLQLNSAYIKQLVRSGDVERLEQAVLEGQGKKLVGEFSADYKTRAFLRSIPALMSKISLLHDAVNSGRLEELQSILDEEPDKKKKLVMAKDEAGVGLLHKAVYYDLKNIYKWLIDKFPQTVNMRDSEGRTPYHYTPMCRDPSSVQKLLRNAGADPSVLDNYQHSAKYYMEHRQDLELPSGQKSNASSRRGTASKDGLNFKKSNIRIWIHQRNMANLQQLLWEGQGGKLLVEHSNNPKMKKFLEAVPHIMGLIKEIHVDTQHGDLESLKNRVVPPIPSLVLSGKDANGLTPLHKAAGLDKQEIADYLLQEYPESINATDNEGRTPLHYAALLKDDGRMMTYLIEHGADESALDNKQKTAAYYKTRHNEIDSKLLTVVPECPRSAKEAAAANFDWSMLTSVPHINGLHNGIKKAEKMLGNAIENHISGKPEELKDEAETKNGNDDNVEVENNNDENVDTNNTEETDQEADNDNKEQYETPENTEDDNNNDENSNNVESDVHPENDESTGDNEPDNNESDDTHDAETHEVNGDDTEPQTNEENHETDEIETNEVNGDNHETENNEINGNDKEPETNEENVDNNDNEPETHDDVNEVNSADEQTNEIDDNGIDNEDNLSDSDDNAKREKRGLSKHPTMEADIDNIQDAESEEKPKSKSSSPSKSRPVSRVDSITRSNSQNVEKSRPASRAEKSRNNSESESRSRSISPDKTRTRSVSPNKSPIKSRPGSKMVEFEDQPGIEAKSRPESKNIEKSRPGSKVEHKSRPSSKNKISSGPIVDGEGVIEGMVHGEGGEKMNNEGSNRIVDTDDDVKALVASGNMEQMAALVLNGEGEKLVGQRSDNTELQSFLENVPVYMSKINRIHQAARDGSLRDLQAALDRRKFAIAKDAISPKGCSPLHVAVIFGNTSIVRYLAGRFPETSQVTDDDGRTPLHYAAVLKDNGHYYNLLVHLGADMRIEDNFGHTPEYYRKTQTDFSHKQLLKDFGAEEKEAEEILTDKDKPTENGQVDMPFFATEEGRYLASSLGDPLIKGLTEVANKRPDDPIAFLAQYLYNFANSRGGLRSRGKTQESRQIVAGSPTNINDNKSVPTNIDVVTVEPEENEDDSAFNSTSRDEHGQSMLHFAAARAHGRNALFQLLIETEINVAYRDELYRTARDISIQANLADNTEEIDRYVLHIATKGDTDKLVELLLDGYDHITDIVDDENVPIAEAVSAANQSDTVSFLQSILAFEEKRERVHHAIRQGNLTDVKDLLADENDTGSGKLLAIGKNSYGRCSLHIGVLCQQEEIVDYLANAFSDTLKLGDNLERTALHYAMGVGKMETISRVLIKAGAKRVSKDLKGRQPTYYFLNKSEILRLQEEEETF